jgi:hypothetical protein
METIGRRLEVVEMAGRCRGCARVAEDHAGMEAY